MLLSLLYVTCENAFEKVSSTWDTFQDKVDPLDEAEDDEEFTGIHLLLWRDREEYAQNGAKF